MHTGGWFEGPSGVMVAGDMLTSGSVNLSDNSADIDGDGIVNLTDVALFTGDFYGAYAFRSDFHYDGEINLADVAKLAQAIGASCP